MADELKDTKQTGTEAAPATPAKEPKDKGNARPKAQKPGKADAPAMLI